MICALVEWHRAKKEALCALFDTGTYETFHTNTTPSDIKILI